MPKLILALLTACALLPSQVAAKIDVTPWAFFDMQPHGSLGGGPLDYIMTANVGVEVNNYTLPFEALAPLIVSATIEEKGTIGFFNYWRNAAGCGVVGIVSESRLECNIWHRELCPVAAGKWRAKNKTTAGATVYPKVTPALTASCPAPILPGTCPPLPAVTTSILDLETGLVTETRAVGGGALATQRVVDDDGKGYVFERWSLESSAAAGLSRRTRGQTFRASQSSKEPSRLVIESPPLPPGHVARPQIGIEPGSLRAAHLDEEERVLVRVEFSPAGALDRVETLVGDPSIGGRLGEELVLRQGDPSHRAVAFALFAPSDDGVELRAVIPVLPRCCCFGLGCPSYSLPTI